MRAFLVVALAAALVLVPVSAGSVAGGPRVKTTKRTIESIGMDGPIVAYDLKAGSGCNQVYVWNVNTNGGKVVSGNGTCEADSTSTGGGVTEIAVGGKRIAWITNEGGNTESDDDLYTSTLPKPKEKHLASAMRTGDIDGQLDGQWIVGVVGDGDLLAVSTYTTEGDNVSDEALRVIGPFGLRTIARGTGTTDSAAAGSGRIAVVRDDGNVALFSAVGKLLHVYATKGASDAALTQHRLLAITDKGLQVFDTGPAGKPIATWKAPVNAVGLDAEGDIAVYSQYCRNADACGRNVYAVRVSTGKTVLLARASTDIEGLEIEPAGVVYAYNTSKGHLVLRSTAQVEAALG
jgi:hypothetical protein